MGRKKTHGRPPGDDWLKHLWSMGPAREIKLSPDNGHVCEELPTCHRSAVVCLKFTHEVVNICQKAYDRYKGKK